VVIRRFRRWLTLLLVVGASACTPAGDAQATFTVGDSMGIRIVTTSRAEWTEPVFLELAEPTLTLPGADATTALSSVAAAEQLSGGRIAVLDEHSQEIIVYGPRGDELFAFGGQGEGPGEFTQAVSMRELPDGTIQVFDAGLQRLTRVGTDGSLAGIRTLADDIGGRPTDAWVLDDGSVLAWTTAPDGPDPRRTTSAAHVFDFSGALVRLGTSPTTVDTIFVGPSSTSIRQVEPRLVWSHPFGARSAVFVDLERSRVLLSTSESHEIFVAPIDGAPTSPEPSRIRFPAADQPIAADELADLRERARARLVSEGAAAATAADLLFDRALQPDVRPAFRKLLAGPGGSIWARRFEPVGDDAPLWWIISDQGRFRGRVALPPRSDVLSLSDDHMLLLRLDELDVPTIDLIPLPVLDRFD